MDSLAEREDETKKIAVEFLLSGVVQGVGFRPYVYNLARKLGLCGYVHNGSRALNIVVEGSRKKVEEFEEEIINHPPALACHATYEAEAASVLGEQVNLIDNKGGLNEVYQFAFKDEIIDPTLILKGVVWDLKTFVPKERIALKFHQTLTDIILKAAKKAYRQTGIKTVVLSGGVWQNRWLFSHTKKGLLAEGFRVLTHHQIPTNDGGIALGQAMIAARRYEKKCV